MRRRPLAAAAAVVLTLAGAGAAVGIAADADRPNGREALRAESPQSPVGPLALEQNGQSRYIVTMRAPALADRIVESGPMTAAAETGAAQQAAAAQAGAIAAAESAGGDIGFRYDTLVNGFSASLSPDAAEALSERPDVESVEPVSVVVRENETSVPFIGADKVHRRFGASGQGVKVAVVDDGIDYTHANFGGPGKVAAYERNDPRYIEPGTFPTNKVIGRYDFVGSGYDVLDESTDNDVPRPDPDPLDDGGGHGSHTAGTCCGIGVKGKIGPGVAPKAKVLSYKVWGAAGDSASDVLIAAYERAVDPNQDGDTSDAADVLSFSGGVDYGTANSAEARAAQRVVDLGTVFVASAGNSGSQAVGGSAYIVGTPATARGVVAVAASIDQYNAQTISIDEPAGLELPDGGTMVQQDWGADLPEGGLTGDLYDGRELDPPADPGSETPADAMFCDPLPGGSLAGQTVLVFKGSTSAGDCGGSLKAFNAQNAGAEAVVLISLFGGPPSALSSGGENVTIPVVMISAADGYAILDELSPAADYNAGSVTATLNDDTAPIAGFEDALTDFTSEGPARVTNDLKPDISAPGFDIKSTAAGTGDRGLKLSGTSMAAPHVSGVAALLVQLHPRWSPQTVKAALMNQATQRMKNPDLSKPVPATTMGAGRVQAFESARAKSVASPASLSFGLRHATGTQTLSRTFTVHNVDPKRSHLYTVSAGEPRYSDFDPSVASVDVLGPPTFKLEPRAEREVRVRLTLDPSAITEADQEDGWYVFHPNVDGNVIVRQSSGGSDRLHVPWHVAPLAASDDSLTEDSLDLTSGPQTLGITADGAGLSYADLYLLGATDEVGSRGEEDLLAVGARSFTGEDASDGEAEGEPEGTDPYGEIGWLDFLTNDDAPEDPVEFGIQSSAVHNVTDTIEYDVYVDAGADGVYAGADEGVDADYVILKQAAAGGEVCVLDLSAPDGLDECSATYFADYSSYNSNVVGLAVDAGDIGITNAQPEIAYSIEACTGFPDGDIPNVVCDSAGGQDDDGVYEARLNATDPALAIDPLTCGGFWDGPDCSGSDGIEVAPGSGTDPSIMAVFPNNAPARTAAIVETTSEPAD